MSRIKKGNYVVIQSWMVTDMCLKGNELFLYAIIYGFSQDNQRFTGSLQYLSEWTHCTKKTVLDNLKSLCTKGYLKKYDKDINGVKFCEYQALSKNSGVEITPGYDKNYTGGGVEITPNNTKDNTKDNTKENTMDRGREKFLPPTVDEVRAYCQERHNNINPNCFVDFYISKGWMVGKSKMKDWRAAVRHWEERDKDERKRSTRNAQEPHEVGTTEYGTVI